MHVKIDRICAPTDFSASGDLAVRHAAALAKVFQAELHILHVLQEFSEKLTHPDFTASGTTVKEFLTALEKGATEYLARLHARLAEKKEYESLVVYKNYLHGNPTEQINHYARNHAVDLLVLGTHGRSGLQHMVMGSVAERVVRTAPCPVLTVRAHQHTFLVDELILGEPPGESNA